MPTYTNSGTSIITVTQPRMLTIPASSTVETNFYLKTLPDNVTLTDHDPVIIPWTLLGTVAAFPSSDITVYSYSSVVIYNASSGVVTVSANGDDANAITLMAGSKEVWNNTNGAFGIITVLTNGGTGNVYVWGTK